jgi:predicted ArsR family transcriptional regulator
MNRILFEIARTPRVDILVALKRRPDLTVTGLGEALRMSYMGVKQHCKELEKDGYLETFRRHRGVGRPELVYRLTAKGGELFSEADNAVLLVILEEARVLFGVAAAEKLLFRYFQRLEAGYAGRLRGGTVGERGKWLARLRDREGRMADWEDGRLVERHDPLGGVARAYPAMAGMECEMMRRLLGVPVRLELLQFGNNSSRVFIVG